MSEVVGQHGGTDIHNFDTFDKGLVLTFHTTDDGIVTQCTALDGYLSAPLLNMLLGPVVRVD